MRIKLPTSNLTYTPVINILPFRLKMFIMRQSDARKKLQCFKNFIEGKNVQMFFWKYHYQPNLFCAVICFYSTEDETHFLRQFCSACSRPPFAFCTDRTKNVLMTLMKVTAFSMCKKCFCIWVLAALQFCIDILFYINCKRFNHGLAKTQTILKQKRNFQGNFIAMKHVGSQLHF